MLFQHYKLAAHQGSAAYLRQANLKWRSLAAAYVGGTHYLIPTAGVSAWNKQANVPNVRGSTLKYVVNASIEPVLMQ